MPEVFSTEIIEPENFQPPLDFNINDVLLEATATPKPLRLVTQKRVHIPKSPFASSGYADDPTLRVWYYLDEGHIVQGPFTSLEMDFWFDSGFFFNELLIRIKENNDFVKLIHLFGKTEIVQVYKPSLLTPMDQLYSQAPQSAELRTAELMSSNRSADKKQSIYTFGFDAEESVSSPLKNEENAQKEDTETIKVKACNEEVAKSTEAAEVKQSNVCVVVEKEGEKISEGKNEEIKPQEDVTSQCKKSECAGQNNANQLNVKGQHEDKNLLSPSGHKKTQGKPESEKKRHSYVEVYEPKMSPAADKNANGKQENKKNKGRDQTQMNKQGTVLQYVVKGEKKDEPEPAKEKREKNNTKGNTHNKKNYKQDSNDKDNKEDQVAGSTPGKKGQAVVIFVPKKKEVTYVEKSKSDKKETPEKMYIPKNTREESNMTNMMANLQPGSLQRKESDTFEILKATSEYYQTDTTKDSISMSQREDSRQSLPPGLQPESMGPINPVKNFLKKPKEKLRLVSKPYDEYEQAQDEIVATALGLLDLEDEHIVNKKVPVKSQFKNNSATPSPLITDNKTVGKLYNFSEDLKCSSFGNQTEIYTDKDC